ncbi:hypothetical protein WUBG_10586, partial [Wuchereria bancrofti]
VITAGLAKISSVPSGGAVSTIAPVVSATPTSALQAESKKGGFRIIRGQVFGTETEECENETAYCYNMTAETALVLNVMKAGCSTYGCMLSANTCRSTTFQGVPISFCCCNEHDLCNYSKE